MLPTDSNTTSSDNELALHMFSNINRSLVTNIARFNKEQKSKKEFSVFELSKKDALIYYRSVEEMYLDDSKKPMCGLCCCEFSLYEFPTHVERCAKYRRSLNDNESNYEPPKKQAKIDLTNDVEESTELCCLDHPKEPAKESVYSHEIRFMRTNDEIITLSICHPNHYSDKKVFAVIGTMMPKDLAATNTTDKTKSQTFCSAGYCCPKGENNTPSLVTDAFVVATTPSSSSSRSNKTEKIIAKFCSLDCFETVFSKTTSTSSYNKIISSADEKGLLYFTKETLKSKKKSTKKSNSTPEQSQSTQSSSTQN